MNKIVREHYPVENLPEDLQHHFAKDALVTVRVELEEPDVQFAPAQQSKPMSGRETANFIRSLHEGRTDKGRSLDEIVAEVRELRDEWDD